MKIQSKRYLISLIILETIGIVVSLFIYPQWINNNWWFFLLPIAVFLAILEALANWDQVFKGDISLRNKGNHHNNTPSFPHNYLPRSEYLQGIKSILLQNNHVGVFSTSKIGTHGMGGIGKSVMAIAIGQDKEINNKFKDGIFWITIGNQNVEKHVKDGQRYIIKELDNEGKYIGDYNFNNQEKSIMQQVLKDKSCLIILDDIWRRDSAYAFDCLGNNSAILITTRDKTIINNLFFQPFEIEILSHSTAKLLLANWVESTPNKLPSEADEIIKECGCLPLGIAIAGSYLKTHPNNWGFLIERLKNADLKKIESIIDHYENYETLFKVIQVSIEFLPKDKQNLINSLSIFPEDAKIPLINITKLWKTYNIEENEVEDLIKFFVDKSLLNYRDSQISFHDIVRDFLRLSMKDEILNFNLMYLKSYELIDKE